MSNKPKGIKSVEHEGMDLIPEHFWEVIFIEKGDIAYPIITSFGSIYRAQAHMYRTIEAKKLVRVPNKSNTYSADPESYTSSDRISLRRVY